MEAARIRIGIADDHFAVRRGLCDLFSTYPDLEVVGEAADGHEVEALVRLLRPDVLLLDLMMPGCSGLTLLPRLRREAAQMRVIVYSIHGSEAYVTEALSQGAVGFVLKDASEADLVEGIRQVHAGHSYLSPPLSNELLARYEQRRGEAACDPYDTLTAREREVFLLSAHGCSCADIAERLRISPRTAETHRNNLMRKLGLHSQTDLFNYATRRGLRPL